MGVGLAVQPEVRAAAEAAAAALAGAGCAVESIRSFLTEEMLDGMCRFFEARSHNDLAQLSAARRGEGAAVHRRVVHLARRRIFRPRRDAGVRAGDGDARGGGGRHRALRLPPLADFADRRLRGRAARAGERRARRAAAHRFHRALEHVGAAGGVGELDAGAPTACRSASSSSASASTMPACCASRGWSSRSARSSVPGRGNPRPLASGQSFQQRSSGMSCCAPLTVAARRGARRRGSSA